MRYSYLHTNGFIHRDVKAANLLIDDDGTVLLGDLGVAASLNEEDSTPMKSTAASTSGAVSPGPTVVRIASLGKRKSFVGTVSVPLSARLMGSKSTHSRVGWRRKSFRKSTMIPKQISGVLVSQPSSLLKAELRGLETLPTKSY